MSQEMRAEIVNQLDGITWSFDETRFGHNPGKSLPAICGGSAGGNASGGSSKIDLDAAFNEAVLVSWSYYSYNVALQVALKEFE